MTRKLWVLLFALVCAGPGASIGGDFASWPSSGDFMAPAAAPADVSIDIRPGGPRNLVKPSSGNLIAVAILGSDKFDVTDVDVTTLLFGPAGAAPAFDMLDPGIYEQSLQDVNRDGIADLVSHYVVKYAGIACGDEEAPLSGSTLGGQAFEGTDRITTLCRIFDPEIPRNTRPTRLR